MCAVGLLELIIIVLVIAWLTGSFIFPVGGAIHLLLVILVIVILVRVIQGRNVV